MALSALLAAKMSPAPLREVLVVDETDTGSMRAVAPAAAASKIPVLLTRGGTVTAEAATFLASEATTATKVVMVGPAARLPKTLSRSLGSAVRITGKDLTTRAGAVNARYYTASKLSPIVADRRYGPEYLTAAVYAARSKRPVVPVAGRVLPDQSRLWITNRRWIIGSVEVFDARGSIPPLMEHMLRKAIYR